MCFPFQRLKSDILGVISLKIMLTLALNVVGTVNGHVAVENCLAIAIFILE